MNDHPMQWSTDLNDRFGAFLKRLLGQILETAVATEPPPITEEEVMADLTYGRGPGDSK